MHAFALARTLACSLAHMQERESATNAAALKQKRRDELGHAAEAAAIVEAKDALR